MTNKKDLSTLKSQKSFPPPVVQEADWEAVELPYKIGSGRTLYSGLEADGRLRLRVFRRSDGNGNKQLVGRVWFGLGADGPPGHAHGGAIAYVLDEAMGSVAWMNDYPSLAAKLEFQYVRMTPLEVDLLVEATIEKVAGRRLTLIAKLILPSGEVCVEGKGEFAILTKSKMSAMNTAGLDPKIIENANLKWARDDAG